MKKLALSLTLLLMIAGSGCGTSGGVDAEVVTNLGTMTIDLYDEQVPETAKNFRELAKAGKYDGIPFHRVIKDFMIQGGDITSRDGTGGHSYKGPGTMIEDEFAEGLTHEKGTLSMANRGPNTGSSQFFIVHAEDGTNRLDGKHAIFGKLVDGYDVLDKIANVETLPGDKPIEDVVVETIKIMK